MENASMSEYEVVKEFNCYGKQMVTVRIENAAHVMSQEEWHKFMVEIIRKDGKQRLIGIDLYQESSIKIRVFLKIGGMTKCRIRL